MLTFTVAAKKCDSRSQPFDILPPVVDPGAARPTLSWLEISHVPMTQLLMSMTDLIN